MWPKPSPHSGQVRGGVGWPGGDPPARVVTTLLNLSARNQRSPTIHKATTTKTRVRAFIVVAKQNYGSQVAKT